MAKELGIENSVRFLGKVNHNQLPILLRSSYISVLPSLYEAVSLSGLESMACGVPVVGTNVGGIPEFVIPSRTGLLIEPKSSQMLADAIIQLLDNKPLRDEMSRECRELIVNNFSWQKIANKTLDFYIDLIRGKS